MKASEMTNEELARARQTLRKLESTAIGWADDVERSERIKRKEGGAK